MSEWKPIESEPPVYGRYLVWAIGHIAGERVRTASFTNYGWEQFSDRITHWMPLPDPPTGGEG